MLLWVTRVEAAEHPLHKKEIRAIRAVVEENFRTSKNEDLANDIARASAKKLFCGLSVLWCPQP
jgi:hypothetical protein